jgi:tRNA A-37 threonylcarbamoyl transferase component Bud32/tetratricopeptide (TPR) repeat protein
MRPSSSVDSIGKYRVQKVIGRGSMGTVYEALDPVFQRKVALKTVAPRETDGPELKARFVREAQAAGRLRHRNIVTVYDVGEENGQPYIAMELVEGVDLEKVIQEKRPLPVEWKIDVLRQICEGLAHAHGNGIVHCDVKPANVRVSAEGEVKIVDFGIALLQSSTHAGHHAGTPHYMAPEQVEGKAVDLRADIFSVGAIAYELLAYRKPFEAESLTGVMSKIVHDGLAPDARALPGADYPGLPRVVLKALAKDPAERYQSLEQMRDALEALVRQAAPRLLARERDAGPRPPAAEEAARLAADVERARAAGQLQKALQLCARLRELDPAGGERLAAEIEAAIHGQELEQIAAMALSYAADGELDLAFKIAAKMERLSPGSPRHRELKSYLAEERARRTADLLIATAQEHLVLGNLEEAVAAAEEALSLNPGHAVAREIRQRAGDFVARRERTQDAEAFGPPPPLVPLPEGDPASPEAASLLESARRLLRERAPRQALPLLERAAEIEPAHAGLRRILGLTRVEARKVEVEGLVGSALDHFLRNEYGEARRAVDAALVLAPGDRKAGELSQVLSALTRRP